MSGAFETQCYLKKHSQFGLQCDNVIITKTNGKVRTSEKTIKLYIVGKVLIKGIQKCNVIEVE